MTAAMWSRIGCVGEVGIANSALQAWSQVIRVAPFDAQLAATIDVLDLEQTQVTTLQLSRQMLVSKFGHYEPKLQKTMPPEKVAMAAAYLLSEDCEITGEAFSLGGGRIARVMIAEAEGVTGLATTEDVRDAMPRVMADASFFYPKDLSERSARVAGVFGFDGGLDTSNATAFGNGD